MTHNKTICYIPATFCMVSLPHSKPDDPEFDRVNGSCAMNAYAPSKIKNQRLGLPYGMFPRLLLIWATTEAITKDERVIHLGKNMSQFLKGLKIARTGINIRAIYQQLLRLHFTTLSVIWDSKDANVILQESYVTNPFAEFKGWKDKEKNQWEASILFSADLFERLTEKGDAVPLSLATVQALRQSPMALDIYCWLTHRMYSLSKKTIISWEALRGQFGADYADTKQGKYDFKYKFCKHAKKVLREYPEAKMTIVEKGIMLSPSPTHIPPELSHVTVMLPCG